MRDITTENLAKLAVSNRPAWLSFKAELTDRREVVIKQLTSADEFGALRMLQGRLAEIDALRKVCDRVDQVMTGASNGTS